MKPFEPNKRCEYCEYVGIQHDLEPCSSCTTSNSILGSIPRRNFKMKYGIQRLLELTHKYYEVHKEADFINLETENFVLRDELHHSSMAFWITMSAAITLGISLILHVWFS
jgi:hypothetical protein